MVSDYCRYFNYLQNEPLLPEKRLIITEISVDSGATRAWPTLLVFLALSLLSEKTKKTNSFSPESALLARFNTLFSLSHPHTHKHSRFSLFLALTR